jgi:hypothetical protein
MEDISVDRIDHGVNTLDEEALCEIAHPRTGLYGMPAF